jgi:bifunctional UDP-N-acetylglucosamine pyrophosphorylase/glucosamine-1-phosphate N-acetyltransferase
MKSSRPKVLHRLAHQSLLAHVSQAARAVGPDHVHVIYGHGGESVREALPGLPVNWVAQEQQLGTGHAVIQVVPHLPEQGVALVLYGDVPLIREQTLQRLCNSCTPDTLALLTVELPDPSGYGRIVRDNGRVQRIVEHKDASEDQRQIREINTGILAAPIGHLRTWLANLDNDNVQGEYYLTDIVAMAVAEGVNVATVSPEFIEEVMGINDRVQLATLERQYQAMKAEELMRQGVTLRDPARFDLRGDVQAGQDVEIDINVIIEGKVVLGNGVHIGPNCVIRDCVIGDGVTVLANCVIEEAEIGAGARVGPFARVRPDSVIHANAHIGNFVEIKKSVVGEGSKINHLSYVGDTEVGRDVNIGAGTITCNYDGANKHKTVIEDNAFIGSDTQLVAPIKVGKGATIGAGTTLTSDAPADQLTLSRVPQKSLQNWKRPTKK